MTTDGHQQTLLTIDEVTAWLRVSRSTFYRAVRSGELPAFKIGGTWRVDMSDVESLIESRKGRAALRPFVSDVSGSGENAESRDWGRT